MSQGLPSTVLPPADPAARAALDAALALDDPDDAGSRSPRSPPAGRGTSTRGPRSVTSAATTSSATPYYRVGYHRGLDALRANGWRGSGYVRWSEPTNRGFLRALAGLGAMAAAIGERDEAERVMMFLLQLDPGRAAAGP